jgi:putative spermidine/putrescine transport system permease protein
MMAWRLLLRFLPRLYLGLVYVFIIGPMLIIIFDSLNSATSFPSPFETVTLRWYLAVLRHDEFLAAMRVSVVVAALAAGIATVLALPAGYVLVRHSLPGRNAIATFLMAPILVPQIVIGLAMLQLLSLMRIELTLAGLVAVHTVYVMPFTLRLVMTGLAHFDFTLEEAASGLGATRLRTLRHVTVPLIRTALVAGFVFAFILSFVNLPLSLFLTNPATATLPIVMFAYMESRIDPLVAAVASMVVVAAVAITLVAERVLRLRLVS